LKLGRSGAQVGVLARREDKLQELRDEIGGNIHILAGDIADPEYCQRSVVSLAEQTGGIDVVFNNAGVSMNALFDDADIAVFHRMMEVNYFGSLYIARYAQPYLEHSRGSIIFVSSIVGKRGFPTRSGYSASKFAIQALFETLRVEWAPKGIHVGLVAPGYTDTEIRVQALGPDGARRNKPGKSTGDVMTADEAAEALLRAAALRKREIVLTTGGKLMVWLNKLAPRCADWAAARVVG
jgi:dehydrogenase/reductase SDR family member 7B